MDYILNKMKIKQILNNFVKDCADKLNLKCILQIGSSTYSKNPNDFDLVFISKNKIFPTSDYLKLLEIIKKFENRYTQIVFDLSDGKRQKKSIYEISVTCIQKQNFDLKVDNFFLKNLAEDKNKKVLFGSDPTKNLEIKFNKKDILIKLNLEINYRLRSCLDKKTKKDAIYNLFKTTLRIMLISQRILKKGELLNKFKTKYRTINLPTNANKILDTKIDDKDFENVLKFSEDCLRFVSK